MFDLNHAQQTVSLWKEQGHQVVFTNGVFDILHVGHVTYLQKAKELGHKLILGLNSDASVRRLNKGPERPINHQDARGIVLLALESVDEVVVFDQDTPLEIIEALQPNILVKGGDYDPNEEDESHPKYLVGSKEVRAWGGQVTTIPIVEGFSTTGIVNKLRSLK
ncbi:MAG: D-glycero-beta-D-manno-heptose 1-phosphate adenylyltransferase [Flavobacteriales bacterium]|nr:D-glycero-beta-D-manno-heptose 1-phosphate adenylyltransferase [Flavobacteriales bacterium]